MKKIIASLAAVVLLIGGVAGKAEAGLKFGPRIGLNVNKLHFNEGIFDGNNQCGFTGGLQLEYMSFLNLGFDASVMYSYMDSQVKLDTDGSESTSTKAGKNFIEIPLNLKYKIGLPMVSSVFAPYIFTGPCVAFKLDKGDGYLDTKTTQWTWNFGLGLEFVRHLQIGASYGVGMNNIMDGKKILGVDVNTGKVKAKNNYWTVTAAWLF